MLTNYWKLTKGAAEHVDCLQDDVMYYLIRIINKREMTDWYT